MQTLNDQTAVPGNDYLVSTAKARNAFDSMTCFRSFLSEYARFRSLRVKVKKTHIAVILFDKRRIWSADAQTLPEAMELLVSKLPTIT